MLAANASVPLRSTPADACRVALELVLELVDGDDEPPHAATARAATDTTHVAAPARLIDRIAIIVGQGIGTGRDPVVRSNGLIWRS